nr:hypothetical protein [Nonomuraea sp. NEAU-A123]
MLDPPASFTAIRAVVLDDQMPTVNTPPADLVCKIALLANSTMQEIASSRAGQSISSAAASRRTVRN